MSLLEMSFPQVVGCIAFFVGIAAFSQKSDVRFRYILTVFSVLMAVHFFMMGATVAGIGAAINATRIYASLKTQSRKLMWIFITLMWVMTLPLITHFFELLTVMGSSLATWALFSKQGIALRFFILCNTVCWLIHNFWIGSIGGTLVEGSFLFINLMTMYRLYSNGEAIKKRS